MANHRGRGRGGRITQVKITLDEDSGEGFLAVEHQILQGIFSGYTGYRSDAMRLVLRHFVENPPDGIWLKKSFRKFLGEGWPVTPSPDPEVEPIEEEAPL